MSCQHQYSTHDLTLAEFVGLDSRQNIPESTTIRIEISCSVPTTQTLTVGQLVSPMMAAAVDETEVEQPTTDQNDQPMMTTLNIENSDPGGTIGNEDQGIDLSLTELNGCLDPKDVAYLLRVYPSFIGLVFGKFIWGKHTPSPSTNPFMIISVVVYAIAHLDLLILSCIYDGLKTSPPRHFSSGHYKIAKYVFYILCFLAPFLLLPVLFDHP